VVCAANAPDTRPHRSRRGAEAAHPGGDELSLLRRRRDVVHRQAPALILHGITPWTGRCRLAYSRCPSSTFDLGGGRAMVMSDRAICRERKSRFELPKPSLMPATISASGR